MSDGTERNDTVTKIPLPSVGDSFFAKSLCRMTDVFLFRFLDYTQKNISNIIDSKFLLNFLGGKANEKMC